jgi:hypothetical protein
LILQTAVAQFWGDAGASFAGLSRRIRRDWLHLNPASAVMSKAKTSTIAVLEALKKSFLHQAFTGLLWACLTHGLTHT